MKRITTLLLFTFFTYVISAQVASDYTVRVSATYIESPASITLTWPLKATAIEYLLYKKSKEESNWGAVIATLDPTATS